MSEVQVAVPGAELAVRSWAIGNGGGTVLCLHETGATSSSWRTLAGALAKERFAAELIAFDRRGWGRSSAPQPYIRTTVAEQAQDAALVLEGLGVERAVICGAGLGAVAALDLALREPQLVASAVLIEPPLLALVEGATEGLSADAERLRKAFEEQHSQAGEAGVESWPEGEAGSQSGDRLSVVAELFLAGELPFLAPGSGRIKAREGGDGREAARRSGTLFAELGAVPAWTLPFQPLAETTTPIAIVTGEETPAPMQSAAQALASHAPNAESIFLTSRDPLLAPELPARAMLSL